MLEFHQGFQKAALQPLGVKLLEQSLGKIRNVRRHDPFQPGRRLCRDRTTYRGAISASRAASMPENQRMGKVEAAARGEADARRPKD